MQYRSSIIGDTIARSDSPQRSRPLHQAEFEVSARSIGLYLQFIKFNLLPMPRKTHSQQEADALIEALSSILESEVLRGD
jgi:hypothetical protein